MPVPNLIDNVLSVQSGKPGGKAGAFNIDGKRKQCREAESGENEPGAENPTSGKDRCGLFNRQSFFAVVNKSRRDIQQGD